ncbi:histidine phosphatase superfamily [Linnemannia elongata]|nr:histidine phosphatase superfamily [Linnemannia elongata]
MQVLGISLGLVALAASQAAAQPSTNTNDLYSDYNYCQGITPIAYKTYKPMKGATLNKVQVMMRHGDRTPSYFLPGDKTNYNICSNPAEISIMANSDDILASGTPNLRTNIVVSPEDNLYASTYWPGNCEVGQLTNRGAAQTRQVGQDLRRVYVDQLGFLSSRLDTEDVYVRNTYMTRTKMTAENFLNGLYPLNTRAKDDVITLNTYPSQIETLALNTVVCPNLTALYSLFKATTYTDKIKANYALFSKVNTIMGWNKVPTYNQTFNGDALMPRYCNKLPLGCSAQDATQCLTVEEVLETGTLSSFIYTGFFREFPQAELAKRLAVGPFLKTFAASIRTTVAAADATNTQPGHGHSSKKRRVRPFELYSAHDQSLDQILSVIAVPSTPWPAYAGTLIFETYKTADKKDVIRVLYEGKVVPANPKLNCTLDACPLEIFLKFIESYVPTDIKAECGL